MNKMEQEIRKVVYESIGYGEAKQASGNGDMGMNDHCKAFAEAHVASILAVVEREIEKVRGGING
jgi:hypothetical protein